MKKRQWLLRGVLGILCLVWMSIIFGFSAQDGEASSGLSSRVTAAVLPVVRPDYPKLEKSVQTQLWNTTVYCVRKGAHFSEYLILGSLLLFWLASWRKIRKREVLYIWLTAVLYAASDEFHQSFSGGRSPRLLDVGIDSAGALVGILLGCLLLWLYLALRAHQGSVLRKKERRML